MTISNRLPSLSVISLSFNQLSSISPGLTETVRDLTLEYNDFGSLDFLRDLALLPNLRTLSLQGNKLDRVYASSESTPNWETPHVGLVFASTLTSLDISHNNIDSWSFIDFLPHIFPGLSNLRVSGNPLYNQPPASWTVTNVPERPMTLDEAFMLTFSRLSQLQVLNYSKITPKDRVNGELYYLSLIRTELSLYPSSAEQRILRSNPRYHELCEIYEVADLKREDDSSADATVNPRSLGARLVTFTFYLKSQPWSPPDSLSPNDVPGAQDSSTNEFTKEIPRSLDVYRIKAIVSRHFSLPALRFKLIWETDEWDPVEQGAAEDDEWDSEEEEYEKDQPLRALNEEGTGAKLVRREEEFVDSTREIGFWLSDDIRNMRVRVQRF